MGKLKYTAAISLALAVVILFAFLPRILSETADRRTLGLPGTRWMHSVQFEIHKNIPSLGKLALLSGNYEVIQIPESKTNLSAREAADALTAAAAPFIDAGLMEDFRSGRQTAQALLVQTETLSGVFWSVSVFADWEATYTIDAVIDDETGQLLGIHVLDQVFRGSALRNEYLYTFAKLYFEGLGISDYSDFQAEVIQDLNKGLDSVTYRFGDMVYGEVEVTLYVREYGFGVELYQTEDAPHEGK